MNDLIKIPAKTEVIETLYKEKKLNKTVFNHLNVLPGQFLLFTDQLNEKSTAIAYVTDKHVHLADSFKNKTLSGFSPKDINQLIYFNMLTENEFILNVALGAAGTGKTTIAIAKAAEDYFKLKKKIYLCKPTIMVSSHQGAAFGPVPGDISEKYAPYIGSFEIVLNKVLGDNSKHYLEMMFKNKHIEFMPVEFTRGCTFENCTFILDEVQNLSWHELKTVLSRIGENSKIIICGDPDQIDANFSYESSGLYKLINSTSFKESSFTSKVILTKQYRGKLPDLIYHIDKE